MQPLGRNFGSYGGERIEIYPILAEIKSLAAAQGWKEELLLAGTDRELVCLSRPAIIPASTPSTAPRRLYISAGIHGDEPAGPAAVLHMFQMDLWTPTASLWICPCLNPTGCFLATRENDAGVDLNRDYLNPTTDEVRAHVAWLAQQPKFQGVICLHEDWESIGFYCYELNPTGSETLAEGIIEAVREVCPIETATMIDGRPTSAPGIIRPSIDPASRPLWPEAFYLWQHGHGRTLTLEAPSDFPLSIRSQALVTATVVALKQLAKPQALRAAGSTEN